MLSLIIIMKQFLEYTPEELDLLRRCSRLEKPKSRPPVKQKVTLTDHIKTDQNFQQTRKFDHQMLRRYFDIEFEERSTRKKQQEFPESKELPIIVTSQFIICREDVQLPSPRNNRADVSLPAAKAKQLDAKSIKKISELKKGLQYHIFRSKCHGYPSKSIKKGTFIYKIIES